MKKSFFRRLKEYYKEVATVLRGEAQAAAVFPNSTDIGIAREQVYAEFLKQHAPSKCNVFHGGFLFDQNGAESKQLDVIITTDTSPRFNFHNRNGSGKSFSPVEGTLGVVSIKSTLDCAQLNDALTGLASVPPTQPLAGRTLPGITIKYYDDWPLKVVYASKGIAPKTLLNHINDFYKIHPEIPENRRANIIHVAGSCCIVRKTDVLGIINYETGELKNAASGEFSILTKEPDLFAITWVLGELQEYAKNSTFITYYYEELINKVNGVRDA